MKALGVVLLRGAKWTAKRNGVCIVSKIIPLNTPGCKLASLPFHENFHDFEANVGA